MLLALLAWSPAPVESLRESLFDSYQQLLPRERKSTPVTIIEIDQAALAEHGHWPWPRTRVAELTLRIAQHQPAAIGFDLLFPDPDRFSPAEMARLIPDLQDSVFKHLQALPSNDAWLAQAIRGRNVVLAIGALDEREPQSSPPLRHFAGYLANVPEIDQAAAGRGMISVDVPERIVRRVPLIARLGESVVPALSLELWRVASAAPWFKFGEAPAGMLELAFPGARIPVQHDGSMWLRYGRHDPARFVSAAEVLDGRANPELIRDKLVLIGLTGVGLLHYKSTPLGEQVPSVELHAQLIEQIVDRAYLTRPAWALWLELAILGGGAALLIVVIPAGRVRFSGAALLALLAALGLIGVGCFARGVLVDAVWPALGLSTVFAVLLAAALAEADRQRHALREAAARSAGELEAARRIQTGLLPDPAVFDKERAFGLRALVQPAQTVGGDFYDCFKVDGERLFFLVGDVSDKGMPAALFMALCKATIKAAVIGSGADPAAALARAAAEIGRDNPESFFVSVFAGALQLDTGKLSYCNAGHEPPYVLSRGRLLRLARAARPPIGVPDQFAFATESLALSPGDWVCALTDGVTEAMNEGGEFYGAQRLEALLASLPAEVTPSQINAAVLADIERFVGSASASDDLALLALRWVSGH